MFDRLVEMAKMSKMANLASRGLGDHQNTGTKADRRHKTVAIHFRRSTEILNSIHKGSKKCQNYMEISILPTLIKQFVKVFKDKLEGHMM